VKRFISSLLAFTLIFGVLVFPGVDVAAKTLEDYNDEYDELEKSLKEKENSLEEAQQNIADKEAYVSELNEHIAYVESQINILNGRIELLNSEIAVQTASIEKLSAEIAKYDAEIKVLEDDITEAKNQLDATFEQLRDRLRESYISGESSTLELLLTSKDISAFLVRAEFIKRTSENDKKLMTKIEGQIDELKDLENEVKVQRKAVADKRAVHEKERAELLGSQNDLKSSVNILETKQQDLGAKKTEAGLLLEKLDKDSAAYKEQIAQIENDMNSIEALIQQYSSSGSATLPEIDIPTGGTVEDGLFEPNSKGWLWPVKAKGMQVCSPYGMRWHPVYGGYRMHTGVDIDSSLGNAYVRRKPIVASKAGVVTYSGWNGGYGKCVIVDHGQGISTLYAHCDELTVNSGQTVAQGQTIALLGTTGTSTGEHLHFEVRVNGSHTNPMNYISL